MKLSSAHFLLQSCANLIHTYFEVAMKLISWYNWKDASRMHQIMKIVSEIETFAGYHINLSGAYILGVLGECSKPNKDGKFIMNIQLTW